VAPAPAEDGVQGPAVHVPEHTHRPAVGPENHGVAAHDVQERGEAPQPPRWHLRSGGWPH
jgi:hypothetical protein